MNEHKYKINKSVVRKAMLWQGLKIGEVAKKSKIHRCTLYRILYTDDRFRASTVGKLATGLGVKSEDLIE